METSTKLEWTKRPNGDWVTSNGLYVIPANKNRHFQLYWVDGNEKLSDRAGSMVEMKELAQAHMDQCVQAGQEAVADVAVAPEQVQAVAEEESLSDTQSLIQSDPDAMANHPSESTIANDLGEPGTLRLYQYQTNVMINPRFEKNGIRPHAGNWVIQRCCGDGNWVNYDGPYTPHEKAAAEGRLQQLRDDLAEPLVEGIEDATNPVASPETVDEILAANPPPILPTPEQIEADIAAIEPMPDTECCKETPTLVWIPIPQPKINETSIWTIWLSECGKYRVYLSCDLFGVDHYFGASVRKPIGVKRLGSEEFGAWDAVDHGRSGFVKYKTLADALEAAAHCFRERTEQPDYASNGDDVLAYAGQHNLLKLPEPKQKDVKTVSEPKQKSDNKPKAKPTPSSTQTEEKTVMKLSEKEARSMCVAVGYKSIGDAKTCPLTKVQHRINTTLLSNVDDLEVPEHDDDKKTLKRVLEALRKGQEIVVISDVLDESEPEEDAATEKAARADKGDKKKGKDKPIKKEPKAATVAAKAKAEPSKNGHAKTGKKTTKDDGKPSMVNRVIQLLEKGNAKKPVTKDSILGVLLKEYPGHEEATLRSSIGWYISSSKGIAKKGLTVSKNDDGYWI